MQPTTTPSLTSAAPAAGPTIRLGSALDSALETGLNADLKRAAPTAFTAPVKPASPAATDLSALTRWITEAAIKHGDDLPRYVAACLGIKPPHAAAVLQQLVDLQWLTTRDLGDERRFAPGALRQVVKRYTLKGLHEDLPWRCDFAPCFDLPKHVARMAQHAFTELLNNAIDHSGGQSVTVSMRQTPLQLQLLVSDDGCGVFGHMAKKFGITDPHVALLELCKGKLTSNPLRHCGRGLFFTSQLADVFDIHANAQSFQRQGWERLLWRVGQRVTHTGTTLYLALQLDTTRTLQDVLHAHSLDQGSLGFERTVVPLYLLGSDQVLASRADAKRAVARLGQFKHVEIDFAGITDIGHAFADEMFRVFRRENPGIELVPVGMCAQVAAMVHSIPP